MSFKSASIEEKVKEISDAIATDPEVIEAAGKWRLSKSASMVAWVAFEKSLGGGHEHHCFAVRKERSERIPPGAKVILKEDALFTRVDSVSFVPKDETFPVHIDLAIVQTEDILAWRV